VAQFLDVKGETGKLGFLLSDRSLEKRLALPAYVDELASTPWQWGECDCTMAVATWIHRITGIDPLQQYRGSYDSPLSAKRTAKQAGGFLSTLGLLFDAAGLEHTQDFETGDVAAIQGGSLVVPVVGYALAIRFGNLWLCKAPRGVIARDFTVITGWRL
jgi:hypothetical protein